MWIRTLFYEGQLNTPTMSKLARMFCNNLVQAVLNTYYIVELSLKR